MTATAEKRRSKRSATGTELNVAELKRALATVKDAVPTRTPQAILKNVRLADGVLTGADGELRIDANIEYGGEPLLLPFDRLEAIVKTITSETLHVSVSGQSATLSTQTSTWTLPTEDAAGYPAEEPTSLPSITRLPTDQFTRAVRGVVYAHDDQSTRYALSAVLIEVRDGVVTFVATDGRRISTVQMEHDLAVDDSETLVPAKALHVIQKIVGDSGEKAVQIDANDAELVATTDRVRVTARLISGKFPRWRDAIKDYETEPTTVMTGSLLAATKAAAICTSEASRGVDFTFTADDLQLHGQSSEAGESRVTCEIVEAGHACTVKLDPEFVRQFLEGLPADGEPTVSIQANEPGDSVFFRCDDFTGVIAPLAAE
jgi:DNA polymerase-3 subunit beta